MLTLVGASAGNTGIGCDTGVAIRKPWFLGMLMTWAPGGRTIRMPTAELVLQPASMKTIKLSAGKNLQ